ncbi:hypothetical protein HPB47_001087, partial [Ixodes persulcatus]
DSGAPPALTSRASSGANHCDVLGARAPCVPASRGQLMAASRWAWRASRSTSARTCTSTWTGRARAARRRPPPARSPRAVRPAGGCPLRPTQLPRGAETFRGRPCPGPGARLRRPAGPLLPRRPPATSRRVRTGTTSTTSVRALICCLCRPRRHPESASSAGSSGARTGKSTALTRTARSRGTRSRRPRLRQTESDAAAAVRRPPWATGSGASRPSGGRPSRPRAQRPGRSGRCSVGTPTTSWTTRTSTAATTRCPTGAVAAAEGPTRARNTSRTASSCPRGPWTGSCRPSD